MLQNNTIEGSGFRALQPNELEGISGGVVLNDDGMILTGNPGDGPGGILGGGSGLGGNGNEPGQSPDPTLGGGTGGFGYLTEADRALIVSKDTDSPEFETLERALEASFDDASQGTAEWTYEFNQSDGLFRGVSSDGQYNAYTVAQVLEFFNQDFT